MMRLHEFLTFASDAEIMALWGAGFVLVALIALVAERRRMKLARIDRIGWMPWMPIFLAAMLVGGGLLMFSLPTVIAG